MALAAGSLNRRIVIQRQDTDTRNALDELVGGWADVCTVWASIRHPGGLETVRAGAETPVTRASIRIRYRRGLDTTMRVVHGSTVYSITAVLPDEQRREYVDLVCEARGADV